MADKMMRVAGRNEDGLAKAINTSPSGMLSVSRRVERRLFPKKTIGAESEYVGDIKHSHGHDRARLMFHFNEGFDLYIRYLYLTNEGGVYGEEGPWELIYSNPRQGNPGYKRRQDITVDLKGLAYQYRIVSKSKYAYQFGDDNREILSFKPNLPESVATHNNFKVYNFISATIQPGGTVLWSLNNDGVPEYINTNGLSWANIRTWIASDCSIFVRYKVPYEDPTPFEKIYVHKKNSGINHDIQFSFRPKYHVFQLLIQNDGATAVNFKDEKSGQGLILSENQMYPELGFENGILNPFGMSVSVGSKTLIENHRIIRTLKRRAELKIKLNFNSKVYIKYFDFDGANLLKETGDWELIGSAEESHYNETNFFEFPINLKTSYFKFAIRNTSNFIGRITDNRLTLSDVDLIVSKTKQERVPSKGLVFKESPLDIVTSHLGYDGIFYTIGGDGIVRTYADITSLSEPLATGADLSDLLDGGRVLYIVKTPQGIAYFEGFNPTAIAYFSENIETTPTEVWRSPRDNDTFFKISSNVNGVDGLILASVYGFGTLKRELLLSKDGGQSYEVIKLTAGNNGSDSDGQPNVNSHWHGNAFDIYHGYIYALEGDHEDRANIWVSRDLGTSWEALKLDSTAHNKQPTIVVPFYDKLAFIRDGDFTGIDEVSKPKTARDDFGYVHQKIEFNDQFGWEFYGNEHSTLGPESYVTFNVQGSAVRPIVIGTGDAGETWHQIYFGVSNVGKIWGMDEQYIYAYNDENEKTLFSEKPKWIKA